MNRNELENLIETHPNRANLLPMIAGMTDEQIQQIDTKRFLELPRGQRRKAMNPYPLPDQPLSILLDSPEIHPAMGTGDPVEDFPSLLPHRRTEPQKAFLKTDGERVWRPLTKEQRALSQDATNQFLEKGTQENPLSSASPANKQLSPEVQTLVCLIQERPLVGELILALLRWIGSASMNASEIWAWKAGAILNRCSPKWDEELPWHQEDIPDRLKAGWEWVPKRGGR